MREISWIVVHCTATQPETEKKAILNYWKNVLGWKNVGYHFLIDRFGVIHELARLDQITNGVRGYNKNSIHISYIGGIDNNGKPKDTRTPNQKYSMEVLVYEMKKKFPDAIIQGHRDFGVNKSCPSFDVKSWIKEINLK